MAVEQVGRRGLGRIRMRHIPDASADSLQGFVEEAIEPGSLVHTDGWVGYDRLEKRGYRHRITVVKGRRESTAEAPRWTSQNRPSIYTSKPATTRSERDGVSFTAGLPWTASLSVVWCASCAAHT